MKKVNSLNTISAIYVVAGILLMMGAEKNGIYGFLALISFIGGWGYSECADQAKEQLRIDEIMKHMDEDGCGND